MTVMRLTLREAINRRIVLVGIIISVAFIALFALGFQIGFSNVRQAAGADAVTGASTIMTVLGLYAVQFLAAFLTVLLSSSAVAGEIDSARLHAVLARPLSRTSWLAQRAGAFALLAVAYVVIMTGAILAIARVIGGYGAVSPGRAIALLVLQVLVLVALGTALSTRLSGVAAGVIVIALYGAAWIAGIMEFVGAALQNADLERVGVVVSLVVPSDALWRGASYYLQSPAFLVLLGSTGEVDAGIPFVGSVPPTAAFVAYSVVYAAAWCWLAARWFARRDL